jgi:hypothetical protein
MMQRIYSRTSCGLRVPGCGFWVTGCGLRVGRTAAGPSRTIKYKAFKPCELEVQIGSQPATRNS